MTEWSTKAFSSNSTPVTVDEALLDEKVVILMQGKNVYNDQIYTYVQLTLRALTQLKDAVNRGENFMPSDFGTVLAAGTGLPSAQLRAEMAITYNMIDVPKPIPLKPVLPSSPVWDED